MASELPPPPTQGPAQPAHPAPYGPPQDARQWSLFAHLSALALFVGIPSFVGPLVIWLVKKDEHPFVAEHAREALNFNISVLIYAIAAGVLSVPFGIITLGIGLAIVAAAVALGGLLWVVFTVIAAVKASNGERYRYPLTLRLIT